MFIQSYNQTRQSELNIFYFLIYCIICCKHILQISLFFKMWISKAVEQFKPTEDEVNKW